MHLSTKAVARSPFLPLLLGACCASCAQGPPSSPLATPAPLQTPAVSRALLHALDVSNGLLATYEVGEGTGRLGLLGTAVLPGARALSADREGRFLYTLDERLSAVSPLTTALRTYAVDARSGALAPRTEVPHPLFPCSLASSEGRVFATRVGPEDTTHKRESPGGALDVYLVGSDGRAVETERRRQDEWSHRQLRVFASPASRLVYLLEGEGGFSRVLRTYRAEADGSLMEDELPLSVDESFGLRTEAVAVAADHLVVASGRRLESFGVDGTTGRLRAEAVVDASDDLGLEPVRFAAGTPDGRLALGAANGLWLFTVDASGRLSPAGRDVRPVLGDLAFHPSGRFLYVSAEGGLVTYQVEPGPLAFFAYDPGVPSGRLAVTPSP